MNLLKWNMDLVNKRWILLLHLKWIMDLKFYSMVWLSSVWSFLLSFHMEAHFWIGPHACLGFDPWFFPLQPWLHLGFKPQCRSICYGLILGLCHSPPQREHQLALWTKKLIWSKKTCLQKWCHWCCGQVDERLLEMVKGKCLCEERGMHR